MADIEGARISDFPQVVTLTNAFIPVICPQGGFYDNFKAPASLLVKTSDIIDTLTSTETGRPLSAAKGKVLNDEIGDLNDTLYALSSGPSSLIKQLSAKIEMLMSVTEAMDWPQIQKIFETATGGYWDSDIANLFEDSAGTVPASVDGVVGLWANVLETPVVSANLAVNGTFAADTDWTKGTGWTISAGVATKAAGTASLIQQNLTLTAGTVYGIAVTVTRTAGTVTAQLLGGTTVVGMARSAAGTYLSFLVAVTGNVTLAFSADVAFAGSIDSVSVFSVAGSPAIQTTTANKSYLRRTPITQRDWLDANTATSALTATFATDLGETCCTIARVGPDGVTFLENQTIGTSYDISRAYGWNGDVMILNRALTATEKALVTRYMTRDKPAYGSLVNAIPQMRGYLPNTETSPDWGAMSSFVEYWRYGGYYFTSFPLIDVSSGTDFSAAWRSCNALTSFPLLDVSSGTDFSTTWYGCSSLTVFPLLDVSNGTDFESAWRHCTGLTSFPLLDVSSGTTFAFAWYNCAALTSFPLLDVSSGTKFDLAWYGCAGLTAFPLLDVSSGTDFNSAWHNCTGLTSFPILDTSSGTDFSTAWYGCAGLTAFPLLDVSSGTDFNSAWRGCTALTSFPASFFDTWVGVPLVNCFLNAWYSCTALTETSVSNIVVSIVASGQSAPATGKDIWLDGAPLLATIQANSTIMTAVSTLKVSGWIPKYKGIAL